MTFLISQDNRIKRLISGGVVIKEVALPLMKLKQLFYAGEKGVLLDPSTAGTLYQTTAMQIPSLPGDPVGIVLDQSQWSGVPLNAAGATTDEKLAPVLGPQLVTNGDFPANVSEWDNTANAVIAYSSGEASVTSSAASNGSSQTISGLTIGSTYRFSGVARRGTNSNNADIRIITISGVFVANLRTTATVNTPLSGVFIATATEHLVRLQQNASVYPAVAFYDNISVREIPGYHATQATAAKRPTYGIHPFGGQRNLLTNTEDFADAVWVKLRVTATADTTTAPDGTLTADTMQTISGTSGGEQAIRQSRTLSDASCFSIYVKKSNWRYVGIRVFNYSIFDFDTETWTLTGAGETVVAENVGNGWYRISSASASTGPSNIGVSLHPTATTNVWGAPIDGTQVFVWGAQLELGATATNYQKVTTQYEVTEAGVPSVHYLSFDGVDDALATPSIDFTATDEMTVFAGVRKLSDAAQGMFLELGNVGTNNGSFHITNLTGTEFFRSKGTLQSSADAPGFTSPVTHVLAGLSDISGDSTILRVNGTQAAINTADQGTGNYGNYPLYIGARAGTSLFFKGHLYGLTVRGKTTTAADIDRAEKITAKLTGITL